MTTITVSPSGGLSFVYSDDLEPLLALGTSSIKRASHVEPRASGGWSVDLTPVGGSVLPEVFRLRQDALDAEVTWLKHNGW